MKMEDAKSNKVYIIIKMIIYKAQILVNKIL